MAPDAKSKAAAKAKLNAAKKGRSDSDTSSGPVVFEKKTYDVTDHFCQVIACITCPIAWLPVIPGVLGKKTLILEPEEAVLDVKCVICNQVTRRPYGELGSVDRGTCLCFVTVASDLSKGMPLCPGWGCDSVFVGEIVDELKKRMKERGDTGVVRRADEQLKLLKSVDQKVDLILSHLNIEKPVQQSMGTEYM